MIEIKHPLIVASSIIAIGLIGSSIVLSNAITKLSDTVDRKIFASNVRVPDEITVRPSNTAFSVNVQNR